MARMGRQPPMLPDLAGSPRDDQPGPGRHSFRLREIALQKIIESTAIQRINRASRSTAPGEVPDYKIGELVDIWRAPKSNDASGWRGPAKIVGVHNDKGLVEVQYRREVPMRVRVGDVRRFMDFNALAFATLPTKLIQTIETAAHRIPQYQIRSTVTAGIPRKVGKSRQPPSEI